MTASSSSRISLTRHEEGRRRAALAPEKIQPWHYDRLAVVYVRQSSPQQVLEHQESTRLQYGLTLRATDLGWTTDGSVGLC